MSCKLKSMSVRWVCLVLAWSHVGCGNRHTDLQVLEAGVATARLPAPVGIGTAGFGPFGAPSSLTPYSQLYPGTTAVHGHPTMKALVLRQSDDAQVVMVRLGQIAVVRALRDDVVARVKALSGRNLEDALILGATHTHAGPGRFVEGSMFALLADQFWPAWYGRLVEAVADLIVQAYDSLEPAELAFGVGEAPSGHADRRCVDLEDYKNSTVPMLMVSSSGKPRALVAAYAVHSTLMGIEQLTLSDDVHGALEEQLGLLFPQPVEIMVFPSWAGDMRPGDPNKDWIENVPVSPRATPFGRIERVAMAAAHDLQTALESLKPLHEPQISSGTIRVPITRDEMGYAEDVFPYRYGASYCSSTTPASCEVLQHLDDMDKNCIAFTRDEPAPQETVLTVARIGPVDVVTWPGEPGTRLAESVMEELYAAGAENVMFLGYANDYLGYQLLEEDWWRGGYEAAGGVWGPVHGEYLRRRLVEIYPHVLARSRLPFVEPPLSKPRSPPSAPHEPTPGTDVGTIVEQPAEQYAALDVVVVGVAGEDPWMGAPIARLLREDAEGVFVPVRQLNGRVFDSDGFGFWMSLHPTPGYHQAAAERQFLWRIHWPVTRYAEVLNVQGIPGRYKLEIQLPRSLDGSVAPTVTFSDIFEITP